MPSRKRKQRLLRFSTEALTRENLALRPLRKMGDFLSPSVSCLSVKDSDSHHLSAAEGWLELDEPVAAACELENLAPAIQPIRWLSYSAVRFTWPRTDQIIPTPSLRL